MAQYRINFTLTTDAPLDAVLRHFEEQTEENCSHEVIDSSGKGWLATIDKLNVEDL